MHKDLNLKVDTIIQKDPKVTPDFNKFNINLNKQFLGEVYGSLQKFVNMNISLKNKSDSM